MEGKGGKSIGEYKFKENLMVGTDVVNGDGGKSEFAEGPVVELPCSEKPEGAEK